MDLWTGLGLLLLLLIVGLIVSAGLRKVVGSRLLVGLLVAWTYCRRCRRYVAGQPAGGPGSPKAA